MRMPSRGRLQEATWQRSSAGGDVRRAAADAGGIAASSEAEGVSIAPPASSAT
jgi:hypothetical protein